MHYSGVGEDIAAALHIARRIIMIRVYAGFGIIGTINS